MSASSENVFLESSDPYKSVKSAPIWSFLFHWSIIGGREFLWNTLGAVQVPVMVLLEIPDNIISINSAIAAGVAVVFIMIIAYLSDRCKLNFGRRRPFIIYLTLQLTMAGFLLWISSYNGVSTVTEQTIVFLSFILFEFGLISLETPLLAFTMESYNKKDRDRIITGLQLGRLNSPF